MSVAREAGEWGSCAGCGTRLPPFIGCPCRITPDDLRRAQAMAKERGWDKLEPIATLKTLAYEHKRTGYCPLCEAGPPPHHNASCPLATLAGDIPA